MSTHSIESKVLEAMLQRKKKCLIGFFLTLYLESVVTFTIVPAKSGDHITNMCLFHPQSITKHHEEKNQTFTSLFGPISYLVINIPLLGIVLGSRQKTFSHWLKMRIRPCK
jgi:hypothetical protein